MSPNPFLFDINPLSAGLARYVQAVCRHNPPFRIKPGDTLDAGFLPFSDHRHVLNVGHSPAVQP